MYIVHSYKSPKPITFNDLHIGEVFTTLNPYVTNESWSIEESTHMRIDECGNKRYPMNAINLFYAKCKHMINETIVYKLEDARLFTNCKEE